jgi:hypothetical protein
MKKEMKITDKNVNGASRDNERGNALFLILIAVALFAALSYAVTQSGRGGGTIDKEQALISASQITQYPSSIRSAVTRMVITGTAISTLNFLVAGTGSAAVFHADGGGVIAQAPPANIGGGVNWGFADATVAANRYYITGVGTDTNATGSDVTAVLDGLSDRVCQQILKGLVLSTTISTTTGAIALTGYQPTTVGGTNIMTGGSDTKGVTNAFGSVALGAGVAFACVLNSGGNNLYYHAIVEQ